ncbi:MAG: flagellar basal body P-ring formation chaperone FlgA [Syntrophorhabdaceae bacterium]|nr:flagellar basal body P-ring formation chaperone FlgA [Syntrophorhabdaceae bacterium]
MAKFERLKNPKTFLLILVCTFLLPLSGICNDGKYGNGETKIIDFINSYYTKKEDINITLNNRPSALNEKDIKIKNITFVKLPDSNGNGICVVEVMDKRNLTRNLFVPFKVTQKKRIYVLKEDMKKGEIITEDKVTVREIIFNEDKKDYPSEIDDVVGKMLKRDLSANTVITKGILEDYFVIKRNDIVSIVLENKKLMVKTKGRAIDRGRIGDVIRVKNLTSQREILGRVTGSGIVHVDM